MPRKNPEKPKGFPCPWPKAVTLDNIKKVADYWYGGDCERAEKLPRSRFNEILGVVLAREMGRLIEAEESAREVEKRADQNAMSGQR